MAGSRRRRVWVTSAALAVVSLSATQGYLRWCIAFSPASTGASLRKAVEQPGALEPPAPRIARRDVLAGGAVIPASFGAAPAWSLASAGSAVQEVGTEWSATAGFDDASFINFEDKNYGAMKDDERRTPLFEKAIQQRLAGTTGMTVLDVGTGPFALLALMAARAGAKKVYAVEASPAAVLKARETIKEASDVPEGVIEVIEGFSTSVTLPEKVDLVLAEIVGSIASEEGLLATIKDTQARHVKRPYDPASYIPARCQTLAAPASYAIHFVLGPPKFDWGKLKGEPIRLNCRDETLQLLAEPAVFEDISFADENLPGPGEWRPNPGLSFTVDKSRIEQNEKAYVDALKKDGDGEADARRLGFNVAHSCSGLAFWPRLVLDPAEKIVVETRGGRGEPQKSHWQTVLPLLSSRPVPVSAGTILDIDTTVNLGQNVNTPARYTLAGRVTAA